MEVTLDLTRPWRHLEGEEQFPTYPYCRLSCRDFERELPMGGPTSLNASQWGWSGVWGSVGTESNHHLSSRTEKTSSHVTLNTTSARVQMFVWKNVYLLSGTAQLLHTQTLHTLNIVCDELYMCVHQLLVYIGTQTHTHCKQHVNTPRVVVYWVDARKDLWIGAEFLFPMNTRNSL